MKLTFRVNTLRENGRYFQYGILEGILLNANVWIFIKISQKFVLKYPINNIPALI